MNSLNLPKMQEVEVLERRPKPMAIRDTTALNVKVVALDVADCCLQE